LTQSSIGIICISQSTHFLEECSLSGAFVIRNDESALGYKIVVYLIPKKRVNEFPLINFWRFEIAEAC
jgi:hypothetical protein